MKYDSLLCFLLISVKIMQIGYLRDVFRDLFLVRYTSMIVLVVGTVNKLDQAKKGLVSTYRHSY